MGRLAAAPWPWHGEMVVFRSQDFRELCGRCREPAERACPRCEQPLCAGHAFPPDGCCEPCAIEIYLTVSRAGKKQLTVGTMVGGAATALFYICWQIQYLPLSVIALVVTGFCASLGALVWGGTVAPRLVNKQLQRQFRRKPELLLGPKPGAAPGATSGVTREERPGRQLGPGSLGVPAQLPEPGNSAS